MESCFCAGSFHAEYLPPNTNWKAFSAVDSHVLSLVSFSSLGDSPPPGLTELPGKRLIWGAVGGDYYVVHYERGRIAHTFHILVAKLPKNGAKPKVVWSAVGGPFKDYAAFLDALRSGKVDDPHGLRAISGVSAIHAQL